MYMYINITNLLIDNLLQLMDSERVICGHLDSFMQLFFLYQLASTRLYHSDNAIFTYCQLNLLKTSLV